MPTLLQAVATRLKANAELAALLTTYQGQPAVFADELAPPNAQKPYVVVSAPVTTPWNALSAKGQDVDFKVQVYARDGQHEDSLWAFEKPIRDSLDEPGSWSPAVTGFSVISISVSAAAPGPYEPGITSRLVSVRALLRRTD